MTKKEIANLRNIKWRTRRDLRITTEKGALDFIDDVGFCFAFASSGIIAGSRQLLLKLQKILLPIIYCPVCGRLSVVYLEEFLPSIPITILTLDRYGATRMLFL